jgi:hypothetical protein
MVNKTIIGKEVLPDGRILEYGARDPATGQRYEILHPAPTPTGTTPTTPTPTPTPTPTSTPTPTAPTIAPTVSKPNITPETPGNYYWTIKNGTAVIVDASGNPVDTTTQTNILMNVGWDFTKIPKYGATTPTTPTAPTTSQPVAPSPISGATTIPKTIKVQGFDIDPTTGKPINIQTGQPLTPTPTPTQTQTQTLTTPTTPKTPTTQTTPQIEAIQAQLKDLQAQQAAMTQYGVSDTNMLEKDAEGNYVKKEVAPKTPDQIRDEVYTKYGIDTAIKDWANAPTKSFEEVYKGILDASGIATITADIQKITNDINKADADYATATGDINDNPWISEAGRVGKIAKLTSAYELTRKRLDNQLTLATGKQSDLKTEAQNVALQTINAYNQQHTWDLNALQMNIDKAEKEIAAELSSQEADQKFRYETYPSYLKTMKDLTAGEKPTIIGGEKTGYYAYFPSTGKKELIIAPAEVGDLNEIVQAVEKQNALQNAADIQTVNSNYESIKGIAQKVGKTPETITEADIKKLSNADQTTIGKALGRMQQPDVARAGGATLNPLEEYGLIAKAGHAIKQTFTGQLYDPAKVLEAIQSANALYNQRNTSTTSSPATYQVGDIAQDESGKKYKYLGNDQWQPI